MLDTSLDQRRIGRTLLEIIEGMLIGSVALIGPQVQAFRLAFANCLGGNFQVAADQIQKISIPPSARAMRRPDVSARRILPLGREELLRKRSLIAYLAVC